MRRSARWGMLTAGALALASSSARADDTATRDAEARFAEGLSRVKHQDYEGARLSFAQAYTVLHRPLILWNLALSEEKSGHPLDALTHFRQVAQEAPSESDRASARKHIESLSAKTSRIDVQAPGGTTFTLDGSDVSGIAPLTDPVDVMPGHHVIVAKLTAGPKTSEVDAIIGQVAHVTFTADAPPAPAPPPVAPVPAEPQPLAATPPDQPPPAHPPGTARTVTAVTLASVAVVAVGFGVGFAVASNSNKSTADTDRTKVGGNGGCYGTTSTECSALNDAVNSQNRDANISNALYFTAGVCAVGAVLSWYFWPKPKDTTAWVTPQVGPGTMGMAAGGRF
jgi:hypothetical protein